MPPRRRTNYFLNHLRRRLTALGSPADGWALTGDILTFLFVKPFRLMRLPATISHVSGPEKIDLEHDELVVVCLVRNGETHIESFIEHHLGLGAKHLVFIDNGSTDATIEIARRYDRVTVLQTPLPFRAYKNWMRLYLMKRFGNHRWVLSLDVDERFDFPFSDILDLRSFLSYLNKHHYNAVVAQMLDMFADEPMSGGDADRAGSLLERFPFYDMSDIRKESYDAHEICSYNTASNADISVYFGGIRRTVFGADCTLTKHPLVFLDGSVKPVPAHFARNARVADISCVLYHFKCMPTLKKDAALAIREKGYSRDSYEYRQYHDVLEDDPHLRIRQPSSQTLQSVNELVDAGFLVVSNAYTMWAEGQR